MGTILREHLLQPSATSMDVPGVRLITFPGNPSGPRNLTFAQHPGSCPFEIKRVYWLHDLHGGAIRGSHAHKTLYQLLTAVTGAFEIVVDNGQIRRSFHLDRPTLGLLLGPGLWRVIRALCDGSAMVVLASACYDEDDYIRDYECFKEYVDLNR